MSWQERDYADDDGRQMGRPPGDWKGMRPSFDNPLSWSVFLFRTGGIAVRVHWFFLAFIVIELLRSTIGADKQATAAPLDLVLMGIAMGSLFVIVLAHEFGHCLACRWVGGHADEILMWPLGGLAFCDPPNHWKARLITVIGGPAVNVILFIVAGGMLGMLTGAWLGVALPNPITMTGLYEPEVSQSLAHQTLFLFNAINLMLLLFNLVPMFPLDGGQMVQAMLWPRVGYGRSMRIAVYTGFVGAVLMGVFGATISNWTLVGVALFGGITCWQRLKQMQWTDDMMGFESDEYAMSVPGGGRSDEPAKPTRAQRKAQRAAAEAQREAAEVDRILQKIADSGMESLTRAEKGLLHRVTERKRREQ